MPPRPQNSRNPREKSRNPAAQRVEVLGFGATFVGAGILLTYIVKQFELSFAVILPMYVPALFAGLTLPLIYATAVGLALPALSSGLTGFPLPSNAVPMLIELAIVSLVISFLMARFGNEKNFRGMVFSAIGVAAGAIVSALLSTMRSDVGSFVYFLGTYFRNGGIALIIYCCLIPFAALRLRRTIHIPLL